MGSRSGHGILVRARGALLAVLAAGLLAGAPAGCGGDGAKAPAKAADGRRDEFVAACIRDGEDRDYCGCLFDGFDRELAPEQIALFVRYIDEGDASVLTPEVRKVFWRVDEACLQAR
ncbi:MAG: hypothetical protein AB7D57_03345 [Desulfovibrionaceae bacterium]